MQQIGVCSIAYTQKAVLLLPLWRLRYLVKVNGWKMNFLLTWSLSMEHSGGGKVIHTYYFWTPNWWTQKTISHLSFFATGNPSKQSTVWLGPVVRTTATRHYLSSAVMQRGGFWDPPRNWGKICFSPKNSRWEMWLIFRVGKLAVVFVWGGDIDAKIYPK